MDLQGKDGFFGKTDEEMDKFCEEHGFCAWYKTSAKENPASIEEAANFLVDEISNRVTTTTPEEKKSGVNLTTTTKDTPKKEECDC